jgi:hypothetical protein
LPQRERNLEDLANDIEKFAMLVQQLTEHKATLAKKVDDNTAQLKSNKEEIKKKEVKLNHLRSVIKNQAFSKEDIHRLENEKANMEEKVRQTRKMKEVNEQSTLTKAMELNKMFGDLHVIVVEFNSRIEALFPKEDEAAPHMISIQKDAAHEQYQSILLGGVDLKGTLVPEWSKEKQQYVEQISQLRRDLFDLTDKKEESDEAVSDIKGDIEVRTCSMTSGANINALSERVLTQPIFPMFDRFLFQQRDAPQKLYREKKKSRTKCLMINAVI